MLLQAITWRISAGEYGACAHCTKTTASSTGNPNPTEISGSHDMHLTGSWLYWSPWPAGTGGARESGDFEISPQGMSSHPSAGCHRQWHTVVPCKKWQQEASCFRMNRWQDFVAQCLWASKLEHETFACKRHIFGTFSQSLLSIRAGYLAGNRLLAWKCSLTFLEEICDGDI